MTLAHRLTSFGLAAWLLLSPLAAIAQDATATDMSLDQAKELIKSGDYDRAIEALRTNIERDQAHPEKLGDAYLQLIKTYVFLGNDYKFRPQGREMSNLNYRAARELIVEVLEKPELRHLKPEPAEEFPPEMITFFSEVRAQKFGNFRVVRLVPRNAVVLFDGDTLGTFPGDPMPGDTDLPTGTHRVQVRAAGYEDVVEDITISPSSTLERSYEMKKKRTTGWYVTRGGVVALAAGALTYMLMRGEDEASGADPLPGAPPPPP
jgi:PEGA domain